MDVCIFAKESRPIQIIILKNILLLKDRLNQEKQIQNFIRKSGKRSIPVTGKKGTVLFFDPLCLHYSDNNNSGTLRDLFLVTYNRIKDGDNYKLSDLDKQNAIKHHKEFIDDQ